MKTTTGLGFGIAAFVACGVLGFWVFGDRHADWFLRAAQAGAVRCGTAGACARIDGRGAVVRSALPKGVCTQASQWRAVLSAKARALPFVVTCRDGATYLFHMGVFHDAGAAQWMICAEPSCTKEAALFET